VHLRRESRRTLRTTRPALARRLHFSRAMRSYAFALLLMACGSTSVPDRVMGDGPVARSLTAAADEAGVPRELLAAIAIEEGGVRLPALRTLQADDHVPVAGALELRHGRLDTLALGARLVGTTEDNLRVDTELATRAGALVVAQLGAETGAGHSLESWHRALELLSGMDDANASAYADRVLAILRTGGTFHAHGNEQLVVAAHDEVTATAVAALAAPPAASDFPGAIWFQTSCTNKCDVGRPLGNAAVNKIVIHDTEGGWDGSVATLQNDGGKSVHYIVDADGSRVGQFRPETDTTWHAGNYYYNETSIGIEHVGVADDPDGYSKGLYDKSRALVASIRSRWSIPLDRKHIVGHYQIPDGTVISESSGPCGDTLENCEDSADFGGANNHRDPGFNWQWCQYMEKLGGSCACNDAWPLWNCTTDHTEAVRCHNGVVEIDQCTGGCDVKAIGTDDVCHTDATGSDSDSGSDTDPGSDSGPGLGSAVIADPSSSGCSTGEGGGGATALVLLGLLGSRRRRRR
jgi:MYXO-CTERM domain-containing protein